MKTLSTISAASVFAFTSIGALAQPEPAPTGPAHSPDAAPSAAPPATTAAEAPASEARTPAPAAATDPADAQAREMESSVAVASDTGQAGDARPDVVPGVDEAAEPELPAQLAVGDEGYAKFGALLQFWGFLTSQDGDTGTTFRVRRAELKMSGEILRDAIAYKLMIDPSKVLEAEDAELEVEGQDPAPDTSGTVTVEQPAGKLSVFQDFEIEFLSEYADVKVGQFKNGMSYEGYNSSSKLLLPERALASREYGDDRDVGIAAEKKFDSFKYFIGVFNGAGLNLTDDNNQKDVVLRLELFPVEGLMLGGVGYSSVGQRDQATTKDRVEVDARLDMSNLLVQAEYLVGWDGSTDAPRTQGHGFYAALGYTLMDRLQPVGRVGYLDTDIEADLTDDDDEVTHYDLGVNYFILGRQAKLAGSVSIFDFEHAPTRTDIILMVQASF